MKYLNMLPYQIREAIEKNVPVVLPLGVVEYHAEHLPLGVDYFVCQKVIDLVEARHPEIIVLPPFYYGSASLAVAPPEGNGTVHVDALKIIPVAEDIFRGLLRVGFRNIHAFIAHQTEEFEQGMPTDLAFRMAGRHVIFEWTEQHSGEGWWGSEELSDYYSNSNNPFNWIRVHSVKADKEYRDIYPGDHAGKGETSMMMHMAPELVELDRIDGKIWFARAGKNATAEYGQGALEAAASAMEKKLFV